MTTPLDCTFPPHLQSDLNALHSIHAHLFILSEDYSDHPIVRQPLEDASLRILDGITALHELFPDKQERRGP